MSWRDGPMCGFDLETTGVDVEVDRIVTATVIWISPGEKPIVHEWLADPGIDIPEGATLIHGITTEHAREHGRPAADVVSEVAGQLALAELGGIPLVLYNAAYDLTLLDRECQRHGVDTPRIGAVVDPLVIGKNVDPYRKGSRKLADVCKHYGVQLGEQGAHNATGDVFGALRLAWKMAGRHRDIGVMPIDVLHEAQVGWYATQQKSYERYAKSMGRIPEDEILPLDWPVRPRKTVDNDTPAM